MSKVKKENVVSFAIGDVVDIANGVKITSLLNLDDHDQLLITDCTVNEGMEYSINGSAWILHECLELIRRATPKTLALAIEIRDAESEVETESYSEEDDDDYDEDYD